MASDCFELQQPSVITWVDQTAGLRAQDYLATGRSSQRVV